MTLDKIKLFLQALHAKNVKVGGDKVTCSCPLATWKHKSGRDNTPSFSIFINDQGRSGYNCFGCGSGSLETLVQSIELYSKEDLKNYDFVACHNLMDDEHTVFALPEYSELPPKDQVFEEWPQYWIDSFIGANLEWEAAKYLGSRGVSYVDTINYNIKYDYKRQMIVFPYRNVFGKFAGARGRSILDNVSGWSKHFQYSFQGRNNSKLVWYGEEVLNLSGPIVVVEGQLDLINTRRAYPKVVANLTALPTREKMRKLADCKEVIHIPDLDDAGIASTLAYAKICAELGLKYKALKLDPPLDGGKIDPDMCSVEYLKSKIDELL